MQRQLAKLPVIGPVLSKILFYTTSCLTSCEISPHATLAGGVYIPHASGIVIGESARVESGVTLYQQVTIGQRHPNDASYPIIKENAYVGAGSKIIGGITVGENAKIGANAVVMIDVPAHAVAVGIPASIVSADHHKKAAPYLRPAAQHHQGRHH